MRHLLIAILILVSNNSFANDIFITQSGDGFTVDIEQDGQNHQIKPKTTTSKIDGDNVTIHARQTKSNNLIEYDQIIGDDNSLTFYQGENRYGWESSSGHGNNNSIVINVEGNENAVVNQQLHNYHDVVVDIQGDGNTISTNQQNYGSKSIDITINNDDNSVSIDQRNGNTSTSHSATVDLDGSYGTTLNLNQSGWAPNSYSLSQNCMTAGGCSVTVTQN